ncbi:CotD family spore coat protein [Halobacillus sp. Marseille-Q1614]|uniref:CotD family spore coat protein n=1 Tax=Halobacillus sp. Marseille-Q1614 TaxID=2709134 RepID=UPI0020C44F70|nr:CotD family spore coat protein [Halobacillus sp. Marseille-Q1614]
MNKGFQGFHGQNDMMGQNDVMGQQAQNNMMGPGQVMGQSQDYDDDDDYDNNQVAPAVQQPTETMPAQVEPVREFTENFNREVLIPVVHPSHTTQIHHTHYKYLHSYPHTCSVVNTYSCENVRVPYPPQNWMGPQRPRW